MHVVQRGHNRARCFETDGDYSCYLRLLRAALHETQSQLHAYVLMTNHVHLLVTPSTDMSISSVMSMVGSAYVRDFNHRNGRVGTLWDGRYRSSLIQTEQYLFTCQRYIELNPVRAAMVRNPADYRWSSYRHHAFGVRNELVTSSAAYLALGESDPVRQRIYREQCGSPLDDQLLSRLRAAFERSVPVGDERFIEEIERNTGQCCRLRPRGRPRAG